MISFGSGNDRNTIVFCVRRTCRSKRKRAAENIYAVIRQFGENSRAYFISDFKRKSALIHSRFAATTRYSCFVCTYIVQCCGGPRVNGLRHTTRLWHWLQNHLSSWFFVPFFFCLHKVLEIFFCSPVFFTFPRKRTSEMEREIFVPLHICHVVRVVRLRLTVRDWYRVAV